MSTKISEIEEDTEDLQEPVTWKDFLTLASKVRQQEELIKISFQNCEILKAEIEKLKK
jgi:hypothetical protein